MLHCTSQEPIACESNVDRTTEAAREQSLRNAEARRVIRGNLGLKPYAKLADHFEAKAPELEGLYVASILKWLPSMGPKKADKFLDAIGVEFDRRTRNLTEAERAVLVHELRRCSR